MIDTHSHILPGVDDGARDFDESVEIVKSLVSQGVTDIIATPHYVVESTFDSPRAKNIELLAQLRERLEKENVPVNLYLGNEIFFNEEIPQLVSGGLISPLVDSKYLLVEISLSGESTGFSEYFLELMNLGYKVVFAHPERYLITQNNYEILGNLYEMGVLFQCNMGSVVGKYGKAAKKLVRRLAKEKKIFMLGSDSHRPLRSDMIIEARKKLSRYYDKEELEQVLIGNARSIIEG